MSTTVFFTAVPGEIALENIARTGPWEWRQSGRIKTAVNCWAGHKTRSIAYLDRGLNLHFTRSPRGVE
jgi:hypothetical protein